MVETLSLKMDFHLKFIALLLKRNGKLNYISDSPPPFFLLVSLNVITKSINKSDGTGGGGVDVY